MPILLTMFIIIPIAEIIVFIKVGEQIGLLATIGLAIITAIIGTSLLRHQGLSVLQNAQKALDEGRIPVDSVIDGICLLIAGAFLLTPGLITDTIGFLLFIAPLRRNIAKYIFKYIIRNSNIDISVYQDNPRENNQNKNRDDTIIDVDYTDIDEEKDKKSQDLEKSKKENVPWRKP